MSPCLLESLAALAEVQQSTLVFSLAKSRLWQLLWVLTNTLPLDHVFGCLGASCKVNNAVQHTCQQLVHVCVVLQLLQCAPAATQMHLSLELTNIPADAFVLDTCLVSQCGVASS